MEQIVVKKCQSCGHKYSTPGCLSRKGDYQVCDVCGSLEALETMFRGARLKQEKTALIETCEAQGITGWVD